VRDLCYLHHVIPPRVPQERERPGAMHLQASSRAQPLRRATCAGSSNISPIVWSKQMDGFVLSNQADRYGKELLAAYGAVSIVPRKSKLRGARVPARSARSQRRDEQRENKLGGPTVRENVRLKTICGDALPLFFVRGRGPEMLRDFAVALPLFSRFVRIRSRLSNPSGPYCNPRGGGAWRSRPDREQCSEQSSPPQNCRFLLHGCRRSRGADAGSTCRV
jgi:hypothetical protein